MKVEIISEFFELNLHNRDLTTHVSLYTIIHVENREKYGN